MDAEDEEFNRVEMESRIKQEYIKAMRKTTREEKISRPAVYEVPTKDVQFMSMPMMDYMDLTQKLALARIQVALARIQVALARIQVALARIQVRELGDRLSKLERGNEPATCPVCSATAYPYPKCGCVFYKEKNT